MLCAELVGECGLTFIGPSPDAIRLMGNKSQARETMAAAEVPILPGSDGPLRSSADAMALADEIGCPQVDGQ